MQRSQRGGQIRRGEEGGREVGGRGEEVREQGVCMFLFFVAVG